MQVPEESLREGRQGQRSEGAITYAPAVIRIVPDENELARNGFKEVLVLPQLNGTLSEIQG